MPATHTGSSRIFEFGPEPELLLRCARVELDKAGLHRIEQLLGTKLDWDRVLSLASMHGLQPLLLRYLSTAGQSIVPKDVFAGLWARNELLKRRNKVMADELLATLRIFDRHDISAIPYKGPSLAVAAYGELSLREFSDLDILVNSSDVFRASRLLQEQGYRSRYEISEANESRFIGSRRQYDIALHHPEREILVELHWRTDREFFVEQLDSESWWAGLGNVELCGARVNALPLRELFFSLCIHAAKHQWERLAWLVDIAELSRQLSEADWEWLVATCHARHCRKRIAVGLLLAADLLDAPVPILIFDELGVNKNDRRVTATVAAGLLRHNPRSPGNVERQINDLRLYDSFGQKLARCRDLLLTPNSMDWSSEAGGGTNRISGLGRRLKRLGSKYLFGQDR